MFETETRVERLIRERNEQHGLFKDAAEDLRSIASCLSCITKENFMPAEIKIIKILSKRFHLYWDKEDVLQLVSPLQVQTIPKEWERIRP